MWVSEFLVVLIFTVGESGTRRLAKAEQMVYREKLQSQLFVPVWREK